MKLKAAITRGTPEAVIKNLGSQEFARAFLEEVCQGQLGAVHVLFHPAAFYVQEPDTTVNVDGRLGVELRLTGVSRGTRLPEQFKEAIKTLHRLAMQAISNGLLEGAAKEEVELFTVLMLDGDTSAPQGGYSNVLELGPDWVSAANAVDGGE